MTEQTEHTVTSAVEPHVHDEALIAEVKAYMEVAHLSQRQFAGYVGIAHSTLRHWLGRHALTQSDGRTCRKVRAFLEANPIDMGPARQERFYDTENVGTMREWFTYCLGEHTGRGRMVCVYGAPGSQKTFIAKQLVAELNRQQLVTQPGHHRSRAYRVYCSQDIRPAQLVEKMLQVAGLPRVFGIQANMAALRFHLRNGRTLFVFDEAQHLSIPCLEIVRELNEESPEFGVMLLGSHKLRMVFENRAAEMEQWNSRLIVSVELPGISDETALFIIQEELAGITEITPGRVNFLLKKSMADDIYSREQNTYRSARKLFNSIDQVRDQVMASIATTSTGGIQ